MSKVPEIYLDYFVSVRCFVFISSLAFSPVLGDRTTSRIIKCITKLPSNGSTSLSLPVSRLPKYPSLRCQSMALTPYCRTRNLRRLDLADSVTTYDLPSVCVYAEYLLYCTSPRNPTLSSYSFYDILAALIPPNWEDL